MKLTVIQAFDWAHLGFQLKHYPVGHEFETDDQELISVSTGEGWTKSDGAAPVAVVTPAAPTPPADGADDGDKAAAEQAAAAPVEPEPAPDMAPTTAKTPRKAAK